MDSAVGRGTTMTVFLPEVTPPRTSLPPAAPALESQPGTEVILLVEDEPSVRLLTQHILRTHGYTVHEAGDGFQALELIRRQDLRVDLVVTDLVMPGMNGKEFLEAFRTLIFPGKENIQIVLVSTSADPIPLSGYESYKIRSFTKPIRIDQLKEIIFPEPMVHELKKH